MNKTKPVRKMSRRDFVKTAAYVAPAILTLASAPSFAAPGSAPVTNPDSHWTTPVDKTPSA